MLHEVVMWAMANAPSPAPASANSSNVGDAINSALPFVNYGVIGVLLTLIASKKIFIPKWVLDDAEKKHVETAKEAEAAHAAQLALKDQQIASLVADKDELKVSNSQLQQVTREQLLPALVESNRLINLYVEVLARRANRTAGDD